MRPGSLRAGAVIDGLVALAESSLSDVVIIDGPAVEDDAADHMLMIGWDANSPVHAIARRGDSDVGMRNAELGEVACYIATRNGDGDMKAARDAAVGILTTFEAALRADRGRLGGACDSAEIGDSGLWQYQTQHDGASVGLPFTVLYEAYI